MELIPDFSKIHAHILQLEQKGMVTRTFRRLDPERQHAVLLAILEEATEKGPHSINIKQVAKRAGVSVGSLYTYFHNRDGLLDFTIELCARWMNDTMVEYRPYLVQMPLRQGLVAYIGGGVEWGQLQSGLTQFFLKAAFHGDGELGEKFVQPIAKMLIDIVREMLEAAIQRGEVREDIDLEATTRLIHALTIALGDTQMMPYLNNYLQVSGDDLPIERVMDAMVGMVMEGIAPRKDT
jgi:AcrR family transcriptional regulator